MKAELSKPLTTNQLMEGGAELQAQLRDSRGRGRDVSARMAGLKAIGKKLRDRNAKNLARELSEYESTPSHRLNRRHPIGLSRAGHLRVTIL
jgi:hypothetical protein